MNPKWLENKILEILQEVQDIKHIMKAVNMSQPPANKNIKIQSQMVQAI